MIGRSDLPQSKILKYARSNLQYPIARAARSVQLAGDSREEYEAILRAGEAIAITAGVTVAAALREQAAGASAFTALQASFVGRGVSQGHWHEVLAAAPSIVGAAHAPIKGMVEGLTTTKGKGLIPSLKVLVEERNRWAHSAGPRTVHEAAARVTEIGPALETAMGRVGFLRNAPWVLVNSSSYRRSTSDFAINAREAMSDHPEFERHDFASRQPLADDTFYLLIEGEPVDLTPFIVMHDCPECLQQELCHADRPDPKHGVALKSFARGHAMYEPALSRDAQNLFGS